MTLDRISAALLGAILLAQGAGKLLSPRGYFAAVARFHVLPSAVVAAVGAAWIAVELIAGSGLIATGAAPSLRAIGLAASIAALGDALGYLALTPTAPMPGTWVPNCTRLGILLPQP